MAPRDVDDASIEDRVAELERVTRKLASSTETLKRSQRETRTQVRHLAEIVEGLPGVFTAKIDQQTSHLETKIAKSQAELAGTWPATAVVIATAAAALIVGATLHLLGWA